MYNCMYEYFYQNDVSLNCECMCAVCGCSATVSSLQGIIGVGVWMSNALVAAITRTSMYVKITRI